MENTGRLNIRCTAAQKAALLEHAAAAELPLVDYLLAAALVARGVKRPKTRSIISETPNAKRVQINIRCSPEQRAALDDAAAAHNVSVSEYIITRGMGHTIKRKKTPPENWRTIQPDTYKKLHWFGEWLNGKAHHLNAGQVISLDDLNAGMMELVSICEEDAALYGWIDATLRGEHAPTTLLHPAHYGALARIANNLSQIGQGMASSLPSKAAVIITLMHDYVRAEADAIVRHRIAARRRGP